MSRKLNRTAAKSALIETALGEYSLKRTRIIICWDDWVFKTQLFLRVNSMEFLVKVKEISPVIGFVSNTLTHLFFHGIVCFNCSVLLPWHKIIFTIVSWQKIAYFLKCVHPTENVVTLFIMALLKNMVLLKPFFILWNND